MQYMCLEAPGLLMVLHSFIQVFTLICLPSSHVQVFSVEDLNIAQDVSFVYMEEFYRNSLTTVTQNPNDTAREEP